MGGRWRNAAICDTCGNTWIADGSCDYRGFTRTVRTLCKKLYRDTAKKAGTDLNKIKVGINSHVFIAEDSKAAADLFYPSYADTMSRIGRERGWSPMNRQQYELMRTKQGALLVGSPDEVIEKMLYEHEIFKYDRFLAQMTVGTMPHDKVLKSIELFGTRVVPEVKKAIVNQLSYWTSCNQSTNQLINQCSKLSEETSQARVSKE